MKVATITGVRQCALVDEPDPRPAGDIVVVKNHAAPMCTEYHAYRDGHASRRLGHEAAGEVVEVAQPGAVAPGDRVVVMPQYPCGRCDLCRAGSYIHCEHAIDPLRATGSEAGTATYAQLILKQDWLLIPIPDGMSYEHASMACCGLGPTFGAMQLMNVNAHDTVLITGMGPVGLGGVINARYRNARVIAVESHPYRAGLARTLGAEAVVDPTDDDALGTVRELTGGRGADASLDASGTAAAKPFLIEATRRTGRVAFVGWHGEVAASELIKKGLSVFGAWHWKLTDAPLMMKMVADLGPQLDTLITHRFPMSSVADAWELQLTGACGKIVLDPWS